MVVVWASVPLACAIASDVVGAQRTTVVKVLKLHPDGSEAWRHRLASWSDANALAVDPAGRVTVIGSSIDGRATVARVAPNGSTEWTRALDHPTSIDDIAVDRAGNVALVGSTNRASSGHAEGVVMALSAEGDMRWHRALGRVGGSRGATRVAVDASGDVIVLATDTRRGALGDVTDLFVVRFDDAGDTAWQRRTVLTHGGSLELHGLELDAAGDLHLVGMASGPFIAGATLDVDWGANGLVLGRWPFLARFDAGDTALTSVVQFGAAAGSTVRGPALDGDGHVWVVGGYLEHPGTDAPTTWRGYLRGQAADGSVRWMREAGQGGPGLVFAAVASLPRGGGLVAAATTGTTDPDRIAPRDAPDAFVRAYTVDGDIAWTRPFRTGSGFRGVVDVAVDGEGNTFVLTRARP